MSRFLLQPSPEPASKFISSTSPLLSRSVWYFYETFEGWDRTPLIASLSNGQVGHEPMTTIVDSSCPRNRWWLWGQLCLSRSAMSPARRSKCKQTHFFPKNLSFYEHISLLNYSWNFRSVKFYVTVPWHGSVAQSVERPKGPSLVQLYWLTRVRFPRETILLHLGIGVRKNRR